MKLFGSLRISSFAARIFWSVVPAFALFLIIQGWINVREQRRLVTSEFNKRGQALAAHLASSSELAVLTEDRQLLGSSIRGAVMDPDVAYVLIHGEDGKRLADGGKQASAVPAPQSASGDQPRSQTVAIGGQRMVEFFAPIVSETVKSADDVLLGQPTVERVASSRYIGGVAVGLSLGGVDAHVANYVRLWVGIAAAFLLLSTLAIYGLSRRITRPINRLTSQAQQIAGGYLEQGIKVEWMASPDEVGRLARAFNDMTHALRANIGDKERALTQLQELNRTLEERIRERTAALEEQSRALAMASRHKSDFLANMSHELRTPLNAILGFSELIIGGIYGDVPASMKSPLTDIGTSGKHLLRLINDVLDLSKIEAGRMELALGDYAVAEIVASAQTYLRPLASEKGLEVITRVPETLPLVHCDGKRIIQCLMNLGGNAVKFTKEGRVEIAAEHHGDSLLFKVSDTGIGIASEDIAHLFTEFRQADATITRDYGGTGLGLSITKKFVEMHGGRVSVESTPGAGSTFSFSIPLRAKGAAAQ